MSNLSTTKDNNKATLIISNGLNIPVITKKLIDLSKLTGVIQKFKTDKGFIQIRLIDIIGVIQTKE